MSPQKISRLYHLLLPILGYLPNKLQVKIASSGRKLFMQHFQESQVRNPFVPDSSLAVKMWGINFRSTLGNSAGMFKNGEGYDLVAKLGAGSYIGGTSTYNPRHGNHKFGIDLPFISLPKSNLAINWLGLPNYGDQELATREITQNKVPGCPIGWSLMRSPDFDEHGGTTKLIESLWQYHDNLQIDFIEINESCPNIKSSGSSIMPRLELIANKFLKQRRRNLPVIVKLSNDVGIASLTDIVQNLVRLGYDGINLGNTSIDYSGILPYLATKDVDLFNYFTQTFGGGISGEVLKKRSLQLCAKAREIIEHFKPDHEFHIIRSGGVSSLADIEESRAHGVSLNQWYTGFFSAYSKDGENIYRNFWAK